MAEQTPSVTQMLGTDGACPEVTFRGRVWKVGHPDQAAKAELENLAVAAAGRNVFPLKAVMPPAHYKELAETFTRAVSTGQYQTWKPGWLEMTSQNPHLFLASLLKRHQPDATEADAMAMMEEADDRIGVALAQVIPSFIRLLLLERKNVSPEQREQVAGAMAESILAATRPPQPSAPTSAAS